jgi:hypothetical protein
MSMPALGAGQGTGHPDKEDSVRHGALSGSIPVDFGTIYGKTEFVRSVPKLRIAIRKLL